MNCLDCLADFRVQTAAVAVCVGCGAAVCGDHARIREHTITRAVPGGMGFLAVPVAPRTRRVRCLPCDAAHRNGDPEHEPGR